MTLQVVAAPQVSAAGAAGTRGMPARSCDAGEKLYLPSSSVVDSDGWTILTYNLDGIAATQEFPPIDFDPLTASTQVIANHNLPPRPAPSGDMSSWLMTANHVGRDRVVGICQDQSTTTRWTTQNAPNWSGVMDLTGSGHTLVGVEGMVKLGSLTGSCPKSKGYGAWVGLGGSASGTTLVQTGVSSSGSSYKTFYEYIPAPPVDFGVTPKAGDSVYELVYVGTSSPYTALLEVVDETSGKSNSTIISVNSVSKFEGSAEWIDERPAANSQGTSYYDLSGYGTASWSEMNTAHSNNLSSWYAASADSVVNLNMTNGGHLLSQTSGLKSGGTTMTDTWKACE